MLEAVYFVSSDMWMPLAANALVAAIPPQIPCP